MTILSKKEALRPTVSATIPVGISKRAILAVKVALAINTPRMSSPASSKNRVFTPQIKEAERV
jgi:hypothetical protein